MRWQAAGLGDRSYALGTVTIEVLDGVARRDDGVLAGSALTMVDAVRNAHALGVPLEAALRAAGEVPARVLRHPQAGRLAHRPAGRHRRARRRARDRAGPGRRRDTCRLLRHPPRCPKRARSSSRRSASSPPRFGGFSSRRPRSRQRQLRCASTAAVSFAWSGTARRTTLPRTACTPLAFCPG